MKRSTMTAAAAILVGLTGVAIAQQDFSVEEGMMVEGGEDFSYAGTWGTSGYGRTLNTPNNTPTTSEAKSPEWNYYERRTQTAAQPVAAPAAATVTRRATTTTPRAVPVTATALPAVTTTSKTRRYSTTGTLPQISGNSSAPTTIRRVSTQASAQTVTAPVQRIVSPAPATRYPATRTAATSTTTAPARTVTRVSQPAATTTRTTTTRTFTAPSVDPRMPKPLMRRVADKAPRSPMEDRLPEGDIGDCFARIMIPATYNDVPDTMTVQDSYEGLVVSQAEFETDVERVKIRDESVKYVVRQPKFRTEMEEVVVKPAYERLHVTPAQWNYVNEAVSVTEPRLVWKAGTGLSGISRVDPKTGVTYCLVEEDAVTKNVQKRVMTAPEQVKASMVPAQKVTVAKQVLIDKGGVDEVIIPAQFREIPIQRLVRKALADRRQVAAREQSYTKRVLATPERFEWVPVLCKTNTTEGALVSIQRELKNRGYYKGGLDGVFGNQSIAALAAFQQDRNIVHAGYITLDTLKALNLGHLSGHNAFTNATALTPKANTTLRGYTNSAMVGSQSSTGAIADAGANLARELAGGPGAVAPAGPIQNRNTNRNLVVPAMTDVGPNAGTLGEIEVEVAGSETRRVEQTVTQAEAPKAKPIMRRRLTWAGRNN